MRALASHRWRSTLQAAEAGGYRALRSKGGIVTARSAVTRRT
jgi:hypothetical protein